MSIYEDKTTYISHRGILKSCEFGLLFHPYQQYGPMNVNINLDEMKDGAVLYVSHQCLQNDFLDKIHCKVILVLGDDDHTFPYCHFILKDDNIDTKKYSHENPALIFSQTKHLEAAEAFYNKADYLEFIESEKIIHCFIQNCAVSHPKITKIPIGLNYHTYQCFGQNALEQEKIIKRIQSQNIPLKHRIMKCYGNFHFNKDASRFGYDRIDAVSQISKDLIDYAQKKTEKYESYLIQSQYMFVVSPHGNGLDCHRTWESMYMNCIPIVKTSVLDDLYDDLPVLIVKEWKDITQELLDSTVHRYKMMQFKYEKLTLKYWVDKIYSCKNT
jgi:hypothetical protein